MLQLGDAVCYTYAMSLPGPPNFAEQPWHRCIVAFGLLLVQQPLL